MNESNSVELKSVDIASTDEPWTTIRLKDGTVIKVRLNITDVCEVWAGDERIKDGHGQPGYNIKWLAVTKVEEKPDVSKAN